MRSSATQERLADDDDYSERLLHFPCVEGGARRGTVESKRTMYVYVVYNTQE